MSWRCSMGTARRLPTATASLLLIAATSLCALGCGDDQDPEGAAALFARIQSENYRGWQRAPGYETRQPSDTAHSDAVDIYVNTAVADALAAGGISEWPLGSTIVKDGFDSDGDLDIIAVMDKRSDGWYWVEWDDPSGEDALFSGKPSICIDCHSAGADFVRAFGLP